MIFLHTVLMIRRITACALAALLAAPGPAFAQSIRLAAGAPAPLAPISAAPVPFAPAPAVLAPSLPVPALPAPSIPAAPAPAALGAPAGAAAAGAVANAANGDRHLIPSMTPSAPERPAEAQAAAAAALFDGTASAEPAALDLRLSAVGRAPAPRPWLDKGKVVLAYGGLTAASLALNAPFDHVAPLVVGAVMSPMLSAMGLFFYGASQSAVPGGPGAAEEARPSGETLALIARLAAEAKVPPPARVKILRGDGVQAQVGMRDADGYEIRVTRAFESLRPEVREAIMRHEFAHERHHDMAWQVAAAFLAPLPVMLGLMGMDGKGALAGLLLAAISAASILLFPASLKRSEYLADQYAASKGDGAGPLARFFIEDSENPARAASALSGTPFASESGWRRRAISAWDALTRTFRAHPSHDRRIARLARLTSPLR